MLQKHRGSKTIQELCDLIHKDLCSGIEVEGSDERHLLRGCKAINDMYGMSRGQWHVILNKMEMVYASAIKAHVHSYADAGNYCVYKVEIFNGILARPFVVEERESLWLQYKF